MRVSRMIRPQINDLLCRYQTSIVFCSATSLSSLIDHLHPVPDLWSACTARQEGTRRSTSPIPLSDHIHLILTCLTRFSSLPSLYLPDFSASLLSTGVACSKSQGSRVERERGKGRCWRSRDFGPVRRRNQPSALSFRSTSTSSKWLRTRLRNDHYPFSPHEDHPTGSALRKGDLLYSLRSSQLSGYRTHTTSSPPSSSLFLLTHIATSSRCTRTASRRRIMHPVPNRADIAQGRSRGQPLFPQILPIQPLLGSGRPLSHPYHHHNHHLLHDSRNGQGDMSVLHGRGTD